jgi:hypothetical protein
MKLWTELFLLIELHCNRKKRMENIQATIVQKKVEIRGNA